MRTIDPTARLKILGIDRDHTDCECCGKSNLKLTVVLGRIDRDGNVLDTLRFGRDCAARASRIRRTGAAMEALAENAQREADERARRVPVRVGDGDSLWVAYGVRGNGSSFDLLQWLAGPYDAAVRWVAAHYPDRETIVRTPRSQ